jgi:hypothetical protein
MSALPTGQKIRSPIAVFVQWCREWAETGSAAELKCCAEEEIGRMAQDAGVSVPEFHRLVKESPEAVDLLLHQRMAALDLDENEVAQTERETFRDLQRVCTMCESKGQCAGDFRRDAADPGWQNYCPNAETLMALDKLPWAARREY